MKWVDKLFFLMEKYHCVKSVRIRSFSGPYFPAFGLNMDRYRVSLQNSVRMRENTDRKNSEYGHFSHSVFFADVFKSTYLFLIGYIILSLNLTL